MCIDVLSVVKLKLTIRIGCDDGDAWCHLFCTDLGPALMVEDLKDLPWLIMPDIHVQWLINVILVFCTVKVKGEYTI